MCINLFKSEIRLDMIKSRIIDTAWFIKTLILRKTGLQYPYFFQSKYPWIKITSDIKSSLESIGVELFDDGYTFYVPLSNCIDHVNLSYSGQSWHYFVSATNEVLHNKNTTFAAYTLAFCPETLSDVFNEKCSQVGAWLNLNRFPASYIANGMPWSTEKRKQNIGPLSKLSHFGPSSPLYIDGEFERLKKVASSISAYGYKPASYYDGYIRGFFLKKGCEYRFVVTSGKHRISMFAHFDIINCLAILDQNDFIPIVDFDAIDSWPQVCSGMYHKDEAKLIFENYFYGTLKQSKRLEKLTLNQVNKSMCNVGE
jgi:hypothetical protein